MRPSNELLKECVAFIRLKPDSDASEESIRSFLKDRLTYFKIPKFIVFCDDFPMTVTGKVQKFILKEQAEAQFGEN